MESNKNLPGPSKFPDWFRAYSQIALLGEISPHVRLIVASFSAEKVCVIRYYFDHEPTEDEIEQAACISSEIASTAGDMIKDLSEECIHSNDEMHKLGRSDGVLFRRME